MQRTLLENCKLIFTHHQKSLVVKESIAAFPSASYSCVLSAISFLCFHFPDLNAPGNSKIQKNVGDHEYPSSYLSYNRNYEPWCDYIGPIVWDKTKGFFYQNEKTLYIVCKIDKFFYDALKQKPQLWKQAQMKCQSVEDLSQIVQQKLQKINKTKKIAIMNLTTSQLRKDKIRPKVDMLCLMSGIWYQQNEYWIKFDILNNHIPSLQELGQLDVVMMTGSGLSVNDQDPYVQNFVQILKQGIKKFQKLKVLGLCFGHQALAKMYGGKVQKYSLQAGIEKVEFDRQIVKKYPYFENILKFSPELFISEYHGDSVSIIPQSFVSIAKSDNCTHESMISQNGKCLSFQFHPQYTNHFTKGYELRIKHYQIQDSLSNFAGKIRPQFDSQQGYEHHKKSSMEIRKLIRNFIEWQIE